MTSGRKLTEEEFDAILRLAGQTQPDGEWTLTYDQIAEMLELHRHTVYRCIRHAAVKFGNRTSWKSDEFA